jgi:hypothetical protein
MKILILSGCLFVFNCIFCQTPVSVRKTDRLLEALICLQTTEKSFYDVGQFPCQRGRYRRAEDNTIFFSSLIALTLKGIQEHIKPELTLRVDSICNYVIRNYENYQNKSGLKTYNFWKTNPPVFFPNSILLSHCSAFHVPDDADCTSIIYLTDTSLTQHAAWLQTKFTEHANQSKLQIKNAFRAYRNFKAYSTWFGKKMPIEFDICVQANVLYFIYKNGLPLTVQDKDCLALIREQIRSGDYLKYAYYLSPSYKKKAIVLYHLSRLLEKNTIPLLEDCRETVKTDIEKELSKSTFYMDSIILSTALTRMGGHPPVSIKTNPSDPSLENYVFFRANLFSSYARPSLRFISKMNLFERKFYCKAYCLALLAEYEAVCSQKK